LIILSLLVVVVAVVAVRFARSTQRRPPSRVQPQVQVATGGSSRTFMLAIRPRSALASAQEAQVGRRRQQQRLRQLRGQSPHQVQTEPLAAIQHSARMSPRSAAVVARLEAAVALVQVPTAERSALQRPALSGLARPSAQVQEAAAAPPSVETLQATVALVDSQPTQPSLTRLQSQLARLAAAVLELEGRRSLARLARLSLAGSVVVGAQAVEPHKHLLL
jgi:hypothetical protein